MRRVLLLAMAATLAAASTGAFAADSKGNFALRGLGAETCAGSTTKLKTEPQFRAYLDSWVGGYMTAINRMQGDTFDVSPILNTGVMTQVVLNVCARSPGDTRLETVAADVVKMLQPARVRGASPNVVAQAGSQSVVLRQETLVTVQQALTRLGLSKEPATGTFTPATSAAIKQFQSKNKLPQTGLPDPSTVLNLLGAKA